MHSLRETARKMLVVDDDAAIRELVSTRLALAGYVTFTARNGIEAMSRLNERRYDGMILDLNMPMSDGYDVLKKTTKARPPTLVLTARHNADDVREAIRLGARDYLTKPFDDQQLLKRVARLMRKVEMPPAAMAAPERRVLEL